jgi:hypothetical protein
MSRFEYCQHIVENIHEIAQLCAQMGQAGWRRNNTTTVQIQASVLANGRGPQTAFLVLFEREIPAGIENVYDRPCTVIDQLVDTIVVQDPSNPMSPEIMNNLGAYAASVNPGPLMEVCGASGLCHQRSAA